jgi:hypothetical protein
VTHTKRPHRDERAILSPESETAGHFQHAVRTKELPVDAAARHDGAAKTWPLDVPRPPAVRGSMGTAPMFQQSPPQCIVISGAWFLVVCQWFRSPRGPEGPRPRKLLLFLEAQVAISGHRLLRSPSSPGSSGQLGDVLSSPRLCPHTRTGTPPSPIRRKVTSDTFVPSRRKPRRTLDPAGPVTKVWMDNGTSLRASSTSSRLRQPRRARAKVH